MNNNLDDKSLLVLGAGATKAFAPQAPLVEDDYGLQCLLSHFSGFPYALELLKNEQHRRNGKINVEQLMTRLHGRMPYDTDYAKAQQTHLLSELLNEFIRRISLARVKDLRKQELAALAELMVEKGVNCITFNYDDILDQALWDKSQLPLDGALQGRFIKYKSKHWHPDGGYGFFVRPSDSTVKVSADFMDKTWMLLLKLHGSINWYARSGEKKPYSIDAIYHNENWFPPDPGIDQQLIARHLESTPFIVPPVLDKAALGDEPVLKTIWSLAKQCLESASSIYFVGYSMPATDLAASFLFSETLGMHVDRIQVINLAELKDDRNNIKSAYRKVFPNIKDNQFKFDGALAWVRQVCGMDSTPGG